MKRAAIVYGFDGTLSKGNVQEHSFLPSLEIKKSSFWRDVRNVAKGTMPTHRATKSNGGSGRLRVLGRSGHWSVPPLVAAVCWSTVVATVFWQDHR